MKDFKINRNSWHYKLNRRVLNDDGLSDHMMQRYWEPKVNNFCAYWRATIGRMLFVALAVSGVSAVAVTIAIGIYLHPMQAVFTVTSIVALIAGIVACAATITYASKKTTQLSESDSLFVAKYRSYKSKICPSVSYDE